MTVRAPIPALATVLAAAVAGLAFAAPAHAEPTRAEYIAQLEPTCKANTDANGKILKGVRKRVKADQLGKAAAQFRRAANVFGATVETLRAVPQPAADAAKLAEWFRYLDLETAYLTKISKALKEEERGKAQGHAVRLQHNADVANGIVAGFGFSACLIDPSKFT